MRIISSQFTPGDKIIVVNEKFRGRTGEFLKNCSTVFPDHCRVKLDLKAREREQKVIMILKSDITAQ